MKMVRDPARRTKVLIISLPGMMQKVLRETFLHRADVEVVGVASGCLSAVGMIRETQPELVVIDSNLPAVETRHLILRLKEEQYPIYSLVLVETLQQIKMAASFNADITLRSHSLPESLDPVFDRLYGDQP